VPKLRRDWGLARLAALALSFVASVLGDSSEGASLAPKVAAAEPLLASAVEPGERSRVPRADGFDFVRLKTMGGASEDMMAVCAQTQTSTTTAEDNIVIIIIDDDSGDNDASQTTTTP
jgi:hypothetical protein